MSDCIFCKFANGEIPVEFVYRDEDVFVIRDINPQASTHFLVSGLIDLVINATAWAAMPCPPPIKPRPSVVVALILTASVSSCRL